jgi:hypothetical protein
MNRFRRRPDEAWNRIERFEVEGIVNQSRRKADIAGEQR